MPLPAVFFFFFQAEDGIRDSSVTGVQTCALPISHGEITMSQARAAGGHAMAAARDLSGPARHAAYAAGQAAVVAHVAAHELGAAAYAIKAARAAAPQGERESPGKFECRWQRDHLPQAIPHLCPYYHLP